MWAEPVFPVCSGLWGPSAPEPRGRQLQGPGCVGQADRGRGGRGGNAHSSRREGGAALVSLLLGPGPPPEPWVPVLGPGSPASVRNHAASRDLGRGTGRCAFTRESEFPWLRGLSSRSVPRGATFITVEQKQDSGNFKKRKKKSHLERGGEAAAFYLAAT